MKTKSVFDDLQEIVPEDDIDQEAADDHAYGLLQGIIKLGRANQPYKHMLKDLKRALKDSPRAAEYAKSLVANIGDMNEKNTHRARSKRR